MSKHRTHGTRWNRLLSGVLCLAMVLGMLPAAGLVQPAQAASWADPYGQQLVDWGVMKPSSDLRLGSTITRAEFVAMCNRAFGYSKLGGIPFVDVPASAWYAQDIDIAYNAGYFMGTTSDPAHPTASPNASLTREQAAVLIARNLMLQETVGEGLDFTDSRSLNDWSRGLIGAAVAEGMISGYGDGSYRPFNNITRGEVAAMLVRAIGTPVNTEGDHELGNVYGNVTISSSNVTLRNTIIVGNLYVTAGVDLGNLLLENVTVLGRIVISGGGESNASQSSVIMRNVTADELVVDSMVDQFVTISAYGITDIPLTNVRSNAYLEDASLPGYGLHRIELVGEPGAKLQLAGSIKEVINKTPFSDLQLVKGTAEKITVDEYARGSQVLVDTGTRVGEMNLDVATLVTGEGDIGDLNIGAEGSEVDMLPDDVVIRPGITATVDGETMGSAAAAELSSEPRLLAGYPNVVNIAPTQAEAMLSGNKPGTIYWAVSDLSSGSVSAEDLISNPTYGGNIFAKQAGNIDAKSKTEYVRQITSLIPDGSYYISAILVDGRGQRSPLKVAAFTTPDNTVPAFVGKPYMSKNTCAIAQVTAMANKNCLLYYALLPKGASAPTPQEFKTGSIGGNYGYGSMSVVKNVPVSINVNRSRLQEKTDYDLYLWLTDHNGAQSSAVLLVESPSPSFTTPDETPPIVTAPIQTGFYADRADVTFSMNEAPSTLFWAVVAEGNQTFIALGNDEEENSALLSDLRTKIKVESGSGALVSSAPNGTAVRTAGVDVQFTIRGLNPDINSYIMYYVGKDAAGNYSDKVGYIRIRTLDTKAPRVHQEFVDAVGERPRATSDIRLVFSEQVKGGAKQSTETDKTFLDFYNDVLAASYDANLRKAAENRLAEELSKHIKLYFVPGNGQPVPLTPRGDDQTDNNWVIDFHKAIIEMDATGQVVITLRGDGDNRALQLESGSTYYFQFLDVYDDAYIPNGLEEDPYGNYKLPNFQTLYAQVELLENTSDIAIVNAVDPELNGLRLDVCFDVIPESTKKVPTTEYWDMIMWSDTSIEFELYRRITPKTTNGPTDKARGWEPVSGAISMVPGSSTSAISFNQRKTILPQMEPVRDGLDEDYIYTYGIHITRVVSVREDDGITDQGEKDEARKKDPTSWSNLVTMKFSLIAGNRVDMGNMFGSVDANYERYVVNNKTISEIGIVYSRTGGEPGKILIYPKQFVDTRVPSFQSGFPTLTAGSGSITMRVALKRPGKLYYVVAPEGSIPTQINAANPINSGNDGSKFTNKDTDIAALKARTYIPINGDDRDNEKYSPHIHFMSGGTTDTEKQYGAPKYWDIIDGKTTYSRDPDIKTPDNGPVEVGSAIETITITGLKASTEYYVYIVLQGGGDPGTVVEIYRATTEKASPPIITASTNGTSSATMVTYDGSSTTRPPDRISSEITYVLVPWTSLPPFFSYKYKWRPSDTTEYTILEAMTIQTGGEFSNTLFDQYAATATTTGSYGSAASYKNEVLQYVTTNGQRWDSALRPVNKWTANYDANDAAGVNRNFANDMTKNSTSEYVVLAVARVVGAGDEVENYGFAATRGLRWPDPDAPEFVPRTTPDRNGVSYLSISALHAYTDKECTAAKEVSDWRNLTDTGRVMGYYYSGEVTVSFNKALYQSIMINDRDVKRAVGIKPNTPTGTLDTNSQVYILDAIDHSGGATLETNTSTSAEARQNFTIKFKGMYTGEMITFINGDIANSSPTGGTTNKQLTLEFNPLLTNREVNPSLSEDFLTLRTGGFIATWKDK